MLRYNSFNIAILCVALTVFMASMNPVQAQSTSVINCGTPVMGNKIDVVYDESAESCSIAPTLPILSGLDDLSHSYTHILGGGSTAIRIGNGVTFGTSDHNGCTFGALVIAPGAGCSGFPARPDGNYTDTLERTDSKGRTVTFTLIYDVSAAGATHTITRADITIFDPLGTPPPSPGTDKETNETGNAAVSRAGLADTSAR